MNKEVKIINVKHKVSGTPDKKNIGRALLTWLQQGYQLVERDEIIGETKAQNYTVLTFAKDAENPL